MVAGTRGRAGETRAFPGIVTAVDADPLRVMPRYRICATTAGFNPTV
jgi:hypothetical protein